MHKSMRDPSLLIHLIGQNLSVNLLTKYFLIRVVYCYGADECMSSLDELQSLTRLSRQTILNCKVELVEAGYIEKTIVPSGAKGGRPRGGFKLTSHFIELVAMVSSRLGGAIITRRTHSITKLCLNLLTDTPEKKRLPVKGKTKVGQRGKSVDLTIKNRVVLSFLWFHAGTSGQILILANDVTTFPSWLGTLGITQAELYSQIEKLRKLGYIYLKFYKDYLKQVIDQPFDFIGLNAVKKLEYLELDFVQASEFIVFVNVPEHICLHEIKAKLNSTEADYDKSLCRLSRARDIHESKDDRINDVSFLKAIAALPNKTVDSLASLYLWVFVNAFSKSHSFSQLEEKSKCIDLIRCILRDRGCEQSAGEDQMEHLVKQVQLWCLCVKNKLQQEAGSLASEVAEGIADFDLVVVGFSDQRVEFALNKK